MASSFQVTTIDLLRHGQPEGGEIFRGRVDVKLSELGFEQMLEAEKKLSDRDVIISSPLQRCLSFSQYLLNNKKNKEGELNGMDSSVAVEDDIREISFGDWDGMSHSDVKQHYGPLYANYWRNPIKYSPPNAEPIDVFAERVSQSILNLAQQHIGKHILLVTHGGVIRAALSYALGAELTSLMCYEVPYASISQIKIYHDEKGVFPQLVFHNR